MVKIKEIGKEKPRIRIIKEKEEKREVPNLKDGNIDENFEEDFVSESNVSLPIRTTLPREANAGTSPKTIRGDKETEREFSYTTSIGSKSSGDERPYTMVENIQSPTLKETNIESDFTTRQEISRSQEAGAGRIENKLREKDYSPPEKERGERRERRRYPWEN